MIELLKKEMQNAKSTKEFLRIRSKLIKLVEAKHISLIEKK